MEKTKKTVFRPNLSRMVDTWLLMALFAGVLVIIWQREELPDPEIWPFVIGVLLLQTLVFTVIFYRQSYFKVEVDGGRLSGPSSWGWGWQRTEIPIRELNLQRPDETFGALGLYLIRSTGRASISLWGFSEEQYRVLLVTLNIIKEAEVAKPRVGAA